MQPNLAKDKLSVLLPPLCVGLLAGMMATVLPFRETLAIAIGIGALTGALMNYSRVLAKDGKS